MPLTSEDFQSLRISVEDLTKAERDLTAALLKGGPGGVQGIAGAPGGVPGVGTGIQARSDGAGLGLSSVRQALAAGGAQGSAALLGLAGGGGAGAAIGIAASAVGELARDYGRIRTAGREAFVDAPLSSDSRELGIRRQAAEDKERVGFGETIRKYTGLVSRYADPRKQEAQSDEERRRIAIKEEDELAPGERALADTRKQLAPLARAGAFNMPRDQMGAIPEAWKTADEFYKLNLEQQRGIQEFERWARVRDARMTSTNPGAQGSLGGR